MGGDSVDFLFVAASNVCGPLQKSQQTHMPYCIRSNKHTVYIKSFACNALSVKHQTGR